MHIGVAKGQHDLARHVVGAFDQVGDNDDVAHTLATIGPYKAPHASRTSLFPSGRGQVVALEIVGVHMLPHGDGLRS